MVLIIGSSETLKADFPVAEASFVTRSNGNWNFER